MVTVSPASLRDDLSGTGLVTQEWTAVTGLHSLCYRGREGVGPGRRGSISELI